MKTTAYQRAEMPSGAAAVLDERSLESSNANLLAVLKEGQQVLDVGCGSGAITQGIAKKVGKDGRVLGVDRSEELIGLAKSKYGHLENLAFAHADILDHHSDIRYDIISTARTLQWIAGPDAVIEKLISLLKPAGILCVLDYNHTRIQWDPQPPQSMLFLYEQFLRWRSDAGMDNAIGDHIAGWLEAKKMKIVALSDESESSGAGQPDFQIQLSIWTKVAQTRGLQLVRDGYLTEEQRLAAIEEYSAWCATGARSMKLDLKATHASL